MYTGAAVVALAVLAGIALRFYRITDNTFVFYDEGMWLLQGQELVRAMPQAASAGWASSWAMVDAAFHTSLRTGKALWAFLSMMRGFFTGTDGYYFTRLISAVLGSLTIGLVFIFARRLYSKTVPALLACALLALMPTHIFYSRLALQEAFSAFFFLLGMYLYLFSNRTSARVFVSAICFAAVYFVNYRMIIIPFFVGCAELYMSLAEKQRLGWARWLATTGLFLMLVFGIGALDGGANLKVTFGWMFHQSELAKGTFSPLNLLSYPYYMLAFEGMVFSAAFWLGGCLLWRKQWRNAFPFVLVLIFMAVFSLPQEKGVRYLASALPFMAMTAAWMIWQIYDRLGGSKWRYAVAAAVIVMGFWQLREGCHVAAFDNSYRLAVTEQLAARPGSKFVSTQSMIQKLYVDDHRDVAEFRYNLKYLAYLNGQGYRYLIVGPQAYVSYTENDLRFEGKLKGFLQFIRDQIEPEREYPHFNRRLLKRFVLEHNEHLGRSLAFLREAEENGYGRLRVYDLNKAMSVINWAVARWQNQ